MRLRKPRLPDDVLRAIELRPQEHILTWTADPDGRYLIATESDLILQRRPPNYERIGWEAIEQASFKDGHLVVDVSESGYDSDALTRLKIPLGSDIELPIVVRDRVTASIAVNQHVPLQDKFGVRVVARKRAGENALRWGYRRDPELVFTPELQAEAEAAVTQVRGALGVD